MNAIDFGGSAVVTVVAPDRENGSPSKKGETMKSIDERLKALPPDLQREVEDFVEFLFEKRVKRLCGKPTFSWAGALRDLRDQYTSVQLQHKISEWRIGER